MRGTDVLKYAFGVSLVLNACAPQIAPTIEAAPSPQTSIVAPPPEMTPYQEVIPKEIDSEIGITVYTDGSYLTEDRLNAWIDEKKASGEFTSDPSVRTVAFMISDTAYARWHASGVIPETGEKILPFLKRNMDKMNFLLSAKTRPSSGITNFRIEPIVVVVDHNLLESQDFPIYSSGETFGRWIWKEDYTPEKWIEADATDGQKYDFILMHELMHRGFYVWAHLMNYFTKSTSTFNTRFNWNSGLRIHGNFPIGDPININLWTGGVENPLEGIDTGMFQMAGNPLFTGSNYMLSEPEELYIRRVSQFSAEDFEPFAFHDKFIETDLAESYSITLGSKIVNSATLYRAKAIGRRSDMPTTPDLDEIEWKFGESDLIRNCVIENGKIILPQDLLSINNRDGMGVGFVLSVDGQLLAFSDYHLLYWHWKTQLKNGETEIGVDGNKYPVEIPISEWNEQSP